MSCACRERVMAGVSKKRKRRPRSKRSRWNRARYRRRRFFAVLVLACLFFGVGTQAAAYFEPENTQAASSANRAKAVNETERPAASREKKPPPETVDRPTRKAAKEDRQEAAREARKEAAKATKQEAIKDAEEASGDPLDVLVLGVDRRPDAGEDSSTRSDTMMLVRVVPASGEVKLLSVPRDLYVEVESGKKNRINSAFAYGGVDQARSVMEDLTGVEIDNYVIVDFEG